MPVTSTLTAGNTLLPVEPALTGKIAIGLGLALGTWLIVDGAYRCVFGHAALAAAHWRLLEWISPMVAGGGHWSIAATGAMLWTAGILWMIVANVYLFQNSLPAWRAMVLLAVASSWITGVVSWVLAAQMILLWLPGTRRRLRA